MPRALHPYSPLCAPLWAALFLCTAYAPAKRDWIVLRAGTKVPLALQTAIEPLAVEIGQKIALAVDGTVAVNQKTLLAMGAPAAATVVGTHYLKREKMVQVTLLAEWAQTVDGQRASLTSVFYTFKVPCCKGSMSPEGAFDGEVLNDIKIKG